MKNNEITEAQKQKAFETVKTTPYLQLIGIEFVDLSGGEAILKLKMREELRQPHGLLHGGATASLIDTTMAFAVVTCLAEYEKASTVDLTVHYLRPLIDGTITCTAKVIKAGKRLLTVSAEVISNEEKLIATALSTYSKV